MKKSILTITLLSALSGITAVATTSAKSNAQQIKTGLTTHQSGFRSTICIQNQPCKSIEMNIQAPQTTAIKRKEKSTKTISKAEDSFLDFLSEFTLNFSEF
tara:strand:- start:117 stop:419 length:303 start_codon:yes stop_codon:yes gene_type:complete